MYNCLQGPYLAYLLTLPTAFSSTFFMVAMMGLFTIQELRENILQEFSLAVFLFIESVPCRWEYRSPIFFLSCAQWSPLQESILNIAFAFCPQPLAPWSMAYHIILSSIYYALYLSLSNCLFLVSCSKWNNYRRLNNSSTKNYVQYFEPVSIPLFV